VNSGTHMTTPIGASNHLLLVDAVIGAGFGSNYAVAEVAERSGLAKFTGNQHNPEWAWDRAALTRLTPATLSDLYQALTRAKQPKAPKD